MHRVSLTVRAEKDQIFAQDLDRDRLGPEVTRQQAGIPVVSETERRILIPLPAGGGVAWRRRLPRMSVRACFSQGSTSIPGGRWRGCLVLPIIRASDAATPVF